MVPLTNQEHESYVNQNTATFPKKNLKSLMIKFIIELETTVITQINTEMFYIAYVIIEDIKYLKKFLQFSTMDQILITNLWKELPVSRRKHRKIHSLFGKSDKKNKIEKQWLTK